MSAGIEKHICQLCLSTFLGRKKEIWREDPNLEESAQACAIKSSTVMFGR